MRVCRIWISKEHKLHERFLKMEPEGLFFLRTSTAARLPSARTLYRNRVPASRMLRSLLDINFVALVYACRCVWTQW